MTNQKLTRFFVTKIVDKDQFSQEYVIINGTAFKCTYHWLDWGDIGVEDTGSYYQTMYDEWYETKRCDINEVPPHCAELNPNKWIRENTRLKIWTRCYLYTPPKSGSEDFALSVAKILLDPENGVGEGSLKRLI